MDSAAGPKPLQLEQVCLDALMQEHTDGEEFIAAANLLKTAFETTGLAYLCFGENTLDTRRTVISSAFSEARRFFDRPRSEKLQAFRTDLPPGVTRGYLPPLTEAGGPAVELKEAFSWSTSTLPDGREVVPLEYPNIWPLLSQGQNSMVDSSFKDSFDDLFCLLSAIMLNLAKALDLVLTSSNQLERECRLGQSVSFARAFHYFPLPLASSENANAIGSAAHTDWGLATLVVQEEGSTSLQALIDGQWRPIIGRRHSIIVNCSDYVTLLSRGRLQSPKHRVILTDRERFSFVFFQYPSFNAAFPSLENVPAGTLDSVSLLANQSLSTPDAPVVLERQIATEWPCFGQFIADKWVQVSRPATKN